MRSKAALVRLLNVVALILFVAGCASIAVGMYKVEEAIQWIRPGALGWAAAYFLVLFTNFVQRAPVQTRGGIVRADDGMFRYAMPYVLLALMGVIFAIVVLTAE